MELVMIMKKFSWQNKRYIEYNRKRKELCEMKRKNKYVKMSSSISIKVDK